MGSTKIKYLFLCMGKKSDSIFGDKRLEKVFSGLLTQIEKRNSVILSKLSET